MDKIFLHRMVFYGYHGLLAEEKQVGQRFEVDLEVKLDLKPAGDTDNIELTVDYGQLFATVQRVMELERYNLLEKAAEEIARLVLNDYPVGEVMVRIRKPGVPIKGVLDYAGVQIERVRK
jgi:dihydroneopterin aldolase